MISYFWGYPLKSCRCAEELEPDQSEPPFHAIIPESKAKDKEVSLCIIPWPAYWNFLAPVAQTRPMKNKLIAFVSAKAFSLPCWTSTTPSSERGGARRLASWQIPPPPPLECVNAATVQTKPRTPRSHCCTSRRRWLEEPKTTISICVPVVMDGCSLPLQVISGARFINMQKPADKHSSTSSNYSEKWAKIFILFLVIR